MASALAKKLMLKSGQRAVILNAPAGYLEQLGELPDEVHLSQEPIDGADYLQAFVHNIVELNDLAPSILRSLKRDGVLWMTYPKRTAKVKTDITRDIGWDLLKASGLEPVAMVAIDEVWSALRFRPRDLVKRSR